MVIEFGRWRLEPLDRLNWELCHWHAATRGKNEGTERWHRLGRYYQWNTLAAAVLFAADVEAKEGGEAVGLAEFAERYESIVARLRDSMGASLRGEVA